MNTNETNIDVVRYWRIKAFIHCLIFLVILISLYFLNQFLDLINVPEWTLLFVLLILVAQWLFYIAFRPSLKAKHWRYDLNENQLIIFKGLWVRQQISIPLMRVQNIESDIGPIAKAFDIAELRVTTASQTNYLPELKREEAFEIQRNIQENIQTSLT